MRSYNKSLLLSLLFFSFSQIAMASAQQQKKTKPKRTLRYPKQKTLYYTALKPTPFIYFHDASCHRSKNNTGSKINTFRVINFPDENERNYPVPEELWGSKETIYPVQIWREKKDNEYFELVCKEIVENEMLSIQKTTQTGRPLRPYTQHVIDRFNETSVSFSPPSTEIIVPMRGLDHDNAKTITKELAKKYVKHPIGIFYKAKPELLRYMDTATLYSIALQGNIKDLEIISFKKRFSENRKDNWGGFSLPPKLEPLQRKKRINIDHINCFGQLPLIAAILSNQPQMVHHLLQHGAHPEQIEPYSGLNAFEVAELENSDFRAMLNADFEEE